MRLPAVRAPGRARRRPFEGRVQEAGQAPAQPLGEGRRHLLVQPRLVMDVAAVPGLAEPDVARRMQHVLVPQGVDIEGGAVGEAGGGLVQVADILVQDALPARLRPSLLDRREMRNGDRVIVEHGAPPCLAPRNPRTNAVIATRIQHTRNGCLGRDSPSWGTPGWRTPSAPSISTAPWTTCA